MAIGSHIRCVGATTVLLHADDEVRLRGDEARYSTHICKDRVGARSVVLVHARRPGAPAQRLAQKSGVPVFVPQRHVKDAEPGLVSVGWTSQRNTLRTVGRAGTSVQEIDEVLRVCLAESDGQDDVRIGSKRMAKKQVVL